MSSSPLETIGKHFHENAFVMIVFFRGHWCPFCQAYLRELQRLSGRVAEKNGAIIAVTAEEESKLPEMRKLSGFEGEMVSDPELQIAGKLRAEGKLDVAVTERAGYPHGMAQPAVVVMRPDRSVIYQWAIVPSMMNLGGAKDRPALEQIVDNAFAALEGREPVHTTLRKMTFWEGIRQKIFG